MSNSTSTTADPTASSTDAPSSSPTPPANTDPTTVPSSSPPITTPSFSPTSVPPSTSPSSSSSKASSSTPSSSSTPPSTSATPPPPSTVTTTQSNADGKGGITTVIITSTSPPPSPSSQASSTSSSSTSVPLAGNDPNGSSSGGLSGGGKTAVEVIVPIAGVALIVLAILWFWRKRKQRKDAEERRRKEVEEYGYNPNEDPTLPAVGGIKTSSGQDGPFEMQEDGAGYRGWGATAAGSSGRKASTTISGGPVGMAYSEGTSPSHAAISDSRSGDTLVGSPSGRPTSGGEEVLGAMGPSAAGNRGGDMHRGPSNASSSYSAANRSDASGEGAIPGGSYGAAQYYSGDPNYGGAYAEGPFGGGHGGRAEASGQPIIRDNLARRATRIENPSHFPTQASAGISQNF